MSYLEIINSFRSEEIPEEEKKVSCWAPFQSMHINRNGDIKVCPFVMRQVWDLDDKTPYKNPPTYTRWKKGSSLRKIWQTDQSLEDLRLDCMTGGLHEWCRYCANQCEQNKPPSSLDYDWVGGDRDLNHPVPPEIELSLSNVCNYKCKFCAASHSSQHMKELPETEWWKYGSIFDNPEVLEAFIDDLRSIIHEVKRLNFTGGEPFAQPVVHRILKMVEEEDPKDLKIQFTTNGSIMNGFVRRFAQRPNTNFTISLDSVDPELYPTLRVNGNFENVMNNIDTLLDYGVAEVDASFVISTENVWTLPKIVEFCNRKGMYFSYHIISPMGGVTTWDDIKPYAVEYQGKEYLNKLTNYLKNAIINTDFEHEGRKEWAIKNNMAMYNQYIERLK